MKKRKLPVYIIREKITCSYCEEECGVVALDNARKIPVVLSLTDRWEYPADWGFPVSDCCKSDLIYESEEVLES